MIPMMCQQVGFIMFFMSTALISFTASFILPAPDIESALNALVSTSDRNSQTLQSEGKFLLTYVFGVIFEESVCESDALCVHFLII